MQLKPNNLTNITTMAAPITSFNTSSINVSRTSTSLTYAELLVKVHTKTLEAIRNLAVSKQLVLDFRREAELIVYMTHPTYIMLFDTNPMPAFIEFDMV